MGCSLRQAIREQVLLATFSIPKADRWAAARDPRRGRGARRRPLSVSPKRIDGLQRRLHRLARRPSSSSFSIPKADRWAAARARTSTRTHSASLSVSPKRIDGLQRDDLVGLTVRVVQTFSIPKADRWAAARLRAVFCQPASCFQYPQSGSMGCSRACRLTRRRARALSVSPKRIDGLQRTFARMAARSRASSFQYPQSGSMGCSTYSHAWLSERLANGFQYPQSGSMGCSSRLAFQAAMSVCPFSIPKADRWAAARLPVGVAHRQRRAFSIPKADRWAAAEHRGRHRD